MSKYIKLAEELISRAKKKGAQAQISINSGSRFSVDVRDGEVEQLIEAGSTSLSLKIIVDNKTATANSSDLNKATLENMIDNTVQRAQFSSPDEFSGLPEFEKIIVNSEDLKLYDEKVEKLSPEYRIDLAKKLESLCLADKRIKRSTGSGFSSYAGETIIVNSNGFSGSYQSSSCGYGVGLQAGESDNLYEDGWYESSHFASDLPSAEETAQKAIDSVVRMIGAKKVKTQNVPIVFDPQMTSSLLSFLISCLYGNSIVMKTSFLSGKINEKIAADTINIIDNGLIPGAPGSRPFDGEGVPVRKTPIIENGILKSYLLDSYSARKLNMKSTGHASGATNFRMASGKYSQEEIIKSVDKGLFLIGTIGQGTVPTTGDISKGAYGIWIENGKLTYPVSEVTFSGNLAEMLKNITMIGNDPDLKHSVSGPTILVSEMTISGS